MTKLRLGHALILEALLPRVGLGGSVQFSPRRRSIASQTGAFPSWSLGTRGSIASDERSIEAKEGSSAVSEDSILENEGSFKADERSMEGVEDVFLAENGCILTEKGGLLQRMGGVAEAIGVGRAEEQLQGGVSSPKTRAARSVHCHGGNGRTEAQCHRRSAHHSPYALSAGSNCVFAVASISGR